VTELSPEPNASTQRKKDNKMQSAPTKSRGWVIALGVMALSLVAGLACPGNLSPELSNGGGGGGGGGGGTPPTCDAPALMAMKCGTTICHDPASSTGGGLDLVSAGQADRLLGQSSTGNNGSECGGMVYLVPGSKPATGLFIDKLTGPTCGMAMPELVAWSPEQNDCVLSWANSITSP
jgi:hypothetical protein